jgi:hypothetical protein
MKSLIILVLLLSGCATSVPIIPKFPTAPDELLEKCKSLNTTDTDTVLLSELTKTIVNNYTLYRECSAKYDGWIGWYELHKKIFEDIK